MQDVAKECQKDECCHNPAEMVKLKTQLASLQAQLREKDERIKQLEDQIGKQAQNVATQVK